MCTHPLSYILVHDIDRRLREGERAEGKEKSTKLCQECAISET